MIWHQKLIRYRYDDLEMMKKECPKPCQTTRYVITDKYVLHSGKGKARFALHMDTRAMNILRVKEEKAMTIDELVANVGGTLGLFLGLSCVSFISAIHYGINKIGEIWCKKDD